MICLAQCYLFAVDVVGLIWVRAKRGPVNEKTRRLAFIFKTLHLLSLWYPCGETNLLWFESVESSNVLFHSVFVSLNIYLRAQWNYLDVGVADRNRSIAFFAFDFHWYHFVRWFVSSVAVVVRLHVRFHCRMDRSSLCRWFVGAHGTISIDLVWCVSRYVRMMRNYTTDLSQMSAKKLKEQKNRSYDSSLMSVEWKEFMWGLANVSFIHTDHMRRCSWSWHRRKEIYMCNLQVEEQDQWWFKRICTKK